MTPRPRHLLPPSPARRTSAAILVVGTVLSVGAVFGPPWVVRCGVAVALLAAVAASALTWRELAWERRQHAAESLVASRAHGQALRRERQHNAAVLQVLTDRNSGALTEIERQQLVISGLRVDVATLRGDKAALASRLDDNQRVIGSLREAVRAREAELRVATASRESAELDAAVASEEHAEVRAMPRRMRLDQEPRLDGAATELWPDGDHPTVGDLRSVQVPVLPNYEEDRRPA